MAPDVSKRFDEWLKPYDMVPEILSNSGTVPRVEAHITRLRNGIPETAIGAAIDRTQSEEAVFLFQNRRRTSHDRMLVEKAAECRSETVIGQSDQDQSQQRPGHLNADCPDPDVDASRLKAAVDPGLTYDRRDFTGPIYCGCLSAGSGEQGPHLRVLHKGCSEEHGAICPENGVRYHYLLPPVSEADFHYGLIANSPDIDKKALEEDQYRPVAAFDDATGVLWIGLDLDVLSSILEAAKTREVTEPARFVSGWPAHAKLELSIDTTWLVSQALLSPVPEQRDFGVKWGDDLQRYRYAAVTLGPSGRPNGVLVTLQLTRN